MKRITVNAGDRYGRLTIVSELPAQQFECGMKTRKFSCVCECGATRDVLLVHLRSGHTVSCGCAKGTHGHAWKRPEYTAWVNMRKRCENPKDPTYKNYGGRGIKVCERWASYENFYADMGSRPSDAHTLERIDNNKGYSPDNCRWATNLEQAINKRTTRFVTYKGRTLHIGGWAKELGVMPSSISYQIRKVGEEAAIAHYLDRQ